jgi:hypothetical protein
MRRGGKRKGRDDHLSLFDPRGPKHRHKGKLPIAERKSRNTQIITEHSLKLHNPLTAVCHLSAGQRSAEWSQKSFHGGEARSDNI